MHFPSTLQLPCLKFKSHFCNSSNDTFRTFISEEFINLLNKRSTAFTTLWVLSQHRTQRHQTSVLMVDETHTHICCVWINSATSQRPFSGHFRHRPKHNFLCPLCNYSMLTPSTISSNKVRRKRSEACYSQAGDA